MCGNFGGKVERRVGDFNNVIEKLQKNDAEFINSNNYSSSRKWGIMDELINKNN